MIIQFRTLFTLTVSHTYYSDGACSDFEFIVPADTGRLLADRKLLAKVRDGKLYVMFEGDEAGAALVSAAGVTMRIGLRLLNPFFSNFTKLEFEPNSVALLYGNITAPGALDAPGKVVMVGRLFSHSPTKAARPVTTALKDPNGHILQTDTITATGDVATVSYDLTGQSVGFYTVEEDYGGSAASSRYYSDPELAVLGMFGIVEVKIDAGFYTASADFQMHFDAKEETLKYYLVAKNYTDAEFNQLSIADSGFADDGRPQLNFTKIASGAFTANDISPALLANGGGKLALFKSQTAVARREKARQKIQLKKNGDVLIEHLAQPAVNKSNADLIIQISKL